MALSNSDDSRLWGAYRKTVFVAEIDGQHLRIHIDLKTPALDEILMRRGLATWAFITAWNPGSRELSGDANVARHEQLIEDVDVLGLQWFEGEGEPADTDWRPERSLLVLGMPPDDAVRIGRRYEQSAIVIGETGAEARLVRCAATNDEPTQ